MRFSTKPFVEHDPDTQDAMLTCAVDLNQRASKLIEAGLLTADAVRACFSLRDLRVLVEGAEIHDALAKDGGGLKDYGKIGEPLTMRQIANLRRDAADIMTAPERPLPQRKEA